MIISQIVGISEGCDQNGLRVSKNNESCHILIFTLFLHFYFFLFVMEKDVETLKKMISTSIRCKRYPLAGSNIRVSIMTNRQKNSNFRFGDNNLL